MQGRRIGRYVLGPEIASGGMASVHLARMLGKAGFGKTVAIKRLHPQYGRDPEFVTLFQEEARVTSALSHANIVMTLDVLEENEELYLVMEYVHGASLSQIDRRKAGQNPLPLRISLGIVAAVLDGLHAAHEATDGNGEPLEIVHRDVSPQNVLVTFQGVAKIADFGIAKAAGRLQSTDDGSVKGKIGYMAPEQLLGAPISARTDIYSAGVVLWETITGRRLIDFDSTAENVRALLELPFDLPSHITAGVPRELDEVVMRAVERTPENRFVSAKEMGTALRKAMDAAHAAEIGDWLRAERPHLLELREKSLANLQRAIGASAEAAGGVGTSPPRARAPNIAGEAEPAIEMSNESRGSAAPDPSSNPSYWTGTGRAAPRAHWFFPALTILLAVGMVGVTFFVLIAKEPSPANPPLSSGSLTSSMSSSSSRASAVPSYAPSEKRSAATTAAVASSAPAAIAMDDPPAPPRRSSSASTASSTQPGATAAAPWRKCRIVPTTDSVGHTKFTEVCQ